MLAKETADTVIALLGNTTDTLSVIASKFSSLFDVKERMVALTGLSTLISDCLCDHQQQIVGLWLLYNEFKSIPLPDHPFLPVFLYIHELRQRVPDSGAQQLFDLLSCIFAGNGIEQFADSSISFLFSTNYTFSVHRAPSIAIPKPAHMRLSPVLPAPSEDGLSYALTPDALAQLLVDSDTYQEFEPPLMRPAPDVCQVFPGEPGFVSSYEIPPQLFDDAVLYQSHDAVISMLKRAATGSGPKLQPVEISTILRELKRCPALCAVLTLDEVEAVVGFVPAVAVELFRNLAPGNQRLVSFIARSPVTDGTAAVARALLSIPSIREEFVSEYITGQIKGLVRERDHPGYARKVALFCGVISDALPLTLSGNLLMDLYSFCVESWNENVKEARELSQLLSR